MSRWPESDPRGRGSATKEVLPGKPGHGYVTMSGYVQGRGRAGDVRLSPWEGRELGPDSEPRERGECQGCYRGEPGHGYVTMSGEVQGSGRAGGPCEGEKEEWSEGRAEPGRAFRVRRRLGGEPRREKSQARDAETDERT